MTIPKLEEVCDNAPFHKDNDGGGSTRELYGERIGSYVGTIKREYYDLIKASPKLYDALREVVEAFDRGNGLAMTIKQAREALAEAAGLEVQ